MGEMNGGSGILMLRKKMEEWGLDAYCSQMFNKDEPYDWRPRYYLGDDYLKESLREFLDEGRLFREDSFHGTIGQGSEQRTVIVKTWDFHLPFKAGYYDLAYDFCDQIEFFTNENANMHPKLAKLCTFCCDTRLAAVYDVEFDDNITRLLSDVILEDYFGWDDRIKVGIQLARLLAWFCMKREMDIKVFDFGSVSDHMHKGVKVPGKYHSGWEAPERESFKEVDPETASSITSMTSRCIETKANDCPTTKEVLNVLEAAAAKMGAMGEKRCFY
ncbi:hypothetical protein BC332_17979 [Capsicum chinense]|nr:hypothetical protein BC332_17979 [Capsicum chinense]